jgi:hypothetical protein
LTAITVKDGLTVRPENHVADKKEKRGKAILHADLQNLNALRQKEKRRAPNVLNGRKTSHNIPSGYNKTILITL